MLVHWHLKGMKSIFKTLFAFFFVFFVLFLVQTNVNVVPKAPLQNVQHTDQDNVADTFNDNEPLERTRVEPVQSETPRDVPPRNPDPVVPQPERDVEDKREDNQGDTDKIIGILKTEPEDALKEKEHDENNEGQKEDEVKERPSGQVKEVEPELGMKQPPNEEVKGVEPALEMKQPPNEEVKVPEPALEMKQPPNEEVKVPEPALEMKQQPNEEVKGVEPALEMKQQPNEEVKEVEPELEMKQQPNAEVKVPEPALEMKQQPNEKVKEAEPALKEVVGPNKNEEEVGSVKKEGEGQNVEEEIVVAPSPSEVMQMIDDTQPKNTKAVIPPTEGLKMCNNADRLANLNSQCDSHPEMKNPTSFFAHTKVDEKHKVIICVVPKAAGTSIHNMMHLTMTGQLAPDPNHCGESCWEDAGVWPLSHYPQEEKLKRLRDYHKIIVVRNPFERLVSCWNDKFKNAGASLHNRVHGFRLIDRIRKVPVEFDIAKELPWSTPLGVLMAKNYSEAIRNELKKDMTFLEFIQLMDNYEQNDPNYHDDHWKPIHDICQPCYVKYDHMVRVETLNRDARHILEKLELDMDKFPHFNSNRESISQLTKELPIYDELPENLKIMLQKYYKDDMDLLGYQWNKDTNLASCNNYNSTGGGTCC